MHAKTIHTNLDINPINVSAPIYLDLKKIHPKTFEKLIASPSDSVLEPNVVTNLLQVS